MPKLVLTDVASGYAATTLINANNALMEAALENTVSRDGSTPNAMAAQLDMGTNRIVNVVSPNNSTDAATKAYVDAILAGTTDAGSAQLRIDLASTANTDGASLSGLEDAGAYYVAANVEAALAELGATTGAAIIGLLDTAGYFTATDVEGALAELMPVGLGNLKGVVDTAGAVDVMTADFTPNIALTDGVVVLVKAFGQITSVTPTFNPDGLGANTIVKGANAALVLSDISSANQTLLLKYDATNTNWELLNPAIPAAPVVSNYNSGIIYITDNLNATAYDIDSNLTVSTWESIGPTGSSATNIWSGLDNVPTGAHTLLLRIYNLVQGATTSTAYGSLVYSRPTGAATSATIGNQVSLAEVDNQSGSSEHAASDTVKYIPVDSSLRFDMQYITAGTPTANDITVRLVGWIV